MAENSRSAKRTKFDAHEDLRASRQPGGRAVEHTERPIASSDLTTPSGCRPQRSRDIELTCKKISKFEKGEYLHDTEYLQGKKRDTEYLQAKKHDTEYLQKDMTLRSRQKECESTVAKFSAGKKLTPHRIPGEARKVILKKYVKATLVRRSYFQRRVLNLSLQK